jgi:hypothetical protein
VSYKEKEVNYFDNLAILKYFKETENYTWSALFWSNHTDHIFSSLLKLPNRTNLRKLTNSTVKFNDLMILK